MIHTNILFSVNAIIETMKKHINLMYGAKMYAEAMQTECALGLFIEQVKKYNLDSVCYETAMKIVKGWEENNAGRKGKEYKSSDQRKRT